MGLFKITAKKSGSWSNGAKMEKGMSIEVIDNNNPLGTTKGRENVRVTFQNKYGVDLQQFASSSYFDVEKLN
jgi:hypothetical protein